MNLWIVNHYASDPVDSATGSRHLSLARGLAELGWTPTIFAASTEHNSGRDRLGPGEPTGTSIHGPVTFRWLRTSGYVANGSRRVLNMLQFAAALLSRRAVAGIDPPDVVIGSTVHPLAAWAAARLAARFRVPFVFEIRDLWPQTLIDMGRLRANGLPARALRRLERSLCDRAAVVITLMPRAVDYLQTVGVEPSKVVWIPNGTDVRADTAAPRPKSTRFQITYAGAFGAANGVETIVRAFALVADEIPDASLTLVGEGPRRTALEALARECGLDGRVLMPGPIPKTRIPDVLADADMLVLNVLDLPIYRYGISMNKLFDYLAAARPIVVATNSFNDPVAEAAAGISVPADDADALSAAIRTVHAADDRQRNAWGANADRYARDHADYRMLAARLDAVLRDVVGGARPVPA